MAIAELSPQRAVAHFVVVTVEVTLVPGKNKGSDLL